jgi:hypothetical protein
LAKVFEDAAGLPLVHPSDGDPDMNEHIIADGRLGNEGEIDGPDDPSEVDLALALEGFFSLQRKHFTRDR